MDKYFTILRTEKYNGSLKLALFTNLGCLFSFSCKKRATIRAKVPLDKLNIKGVNVIIIAFPDQFKLEMIKAALNRLSKIVECCIFVLKKDSPFCPPHTGLIKLTSPQAGFTNAAIVSNLLGRPTDFNDSMLQFGLKSGIFKIVSPERFFLDDSAFDLCSVEDVRAQIESDQRRAKEREQNYLTRAQRLAEEVSGFERIFVTGARHSGKSRLINTLQNILNRSDLLEFDGTDLRNWPAENNFPKELLTSKPNSKGGPENWICVIIVSNDQSRKYFHESQISNTWTFGPFSKKGISEQVRAWTASVPKASRVYFASVI